MTINQLGLHPVVAVPARNEVARLPMLLQALAAQTWLTKPCRRLDVVLVLNNSVDGSRQLIEAARSLYPGLRLEVIDIELPPQRAHVGWARRIAMDRAYSKRAASGALLSTDADAIPASNWIDATLDAIRAGADLVGGKIIGNKPEEAALGKSFVRRAMRHLEYAEMTDHLVSLMRPVVHDPWPRHSDHTAASLAVRSEVYAALGGIPPLPSGEDLAFVARAVTAGYRLRHPLDVRVGVSARLEGRARGGMADTLKEWVAAEATGQPHFVEIPDSIFARLAGGRRLRPHHYAPAQSSSAQAPRSEIEVEAAIPRLRQLVADLEGNPC